MADPRLVDYIKHGLKSGTPIEHMEKALISEGWRKKDVDEAIDVIIEEREKEHIIPTHQAPKVYTTKVPELMGEEKFSGQPQEQPPGQPETPPEPPAESQYKSMGVFSKFKMVLAHPGKFFQAVKAEKGYEGPVKYYLFLLFIQIIIANIVLYLSLTLGAAFFDPSLINPLMGMFALTTVSDFLFANISLVMSIVVLFIIAWFFNIFLRLLKGKGRMVDTLKGIVYAYTPNVILTLITIPIALLILFSILPSISPGNIFLDFNLAEMPLETLILSLMSVVFLIWTLYLELKGLSVFHEISIWRVLGALILGIIVLYVIIGIVFGLVIGLFFLGMFAVP
jgi:hypothetical protein